jgi:hypothetical protein
MMRFIACLPARQVGANSFAHKALNRRMNSPLHEAQLLDLGLMANGGYVLNGAPMAPGVLK